MASSTLDYSSHNKKISKLRGESWRRKLHEAKMRQKKHTTAIAAARATRLMTQKDFRAHLKTNNETIFSRIERGDVHTSKDRAHIIAKVLGKPVSDLFIEYDAGKFIAI